MQREEGTPAASEDFVAACANVALTLIYSAPTPGAGSRYADRAVALETRLLAVPPLREALAGAAGRGIGETVLEGVLSSLGLAGYADVRAAGHLAPLAQSALLDRPLRRTLSGLGHEDLAPFLRALEAAEGASWSPLGEAIRVALGSGEGATLRDAMRFAVSRDAMAREYARGYEVTEQLARPAIIAALSRAGSARAALVHSYLEVLSEVPDLDVAGRAGQKEAEEISRMARGVIKTGGVFSRRGLQAIANFDGLLRGDVRLVPSATEPAVCGAAFLVALEHGPEALARRVRPAAGDGGR